MLLRIRHAERMCLAEVFSRISHAGRMCLAGRASKDVSCRTDVFSIGASKNKLHKSCRKDAFSRGAPPRICHAGKMC